MPHQMINFMRAPAVAVILYALLVGNVQALVRRSLALLTAEPLHALPLQPQTC